MANDKQGGGSQDNRYVAALAMRGANPALKIIVYVCYGIIALGSLALVSPPYETAFKLGALGILVGALLIVAILVLIRYQALTQETPLPVRPAPVPPPVPGPRHLSSADRRLILETLDEAREAAQKFLSGYNANIKITQVRANVFLPEYTDNDAAKPCVLKIKPGLHQNMNRPKEIEIPLKPGQGATGRAFESSSSRVAIRLPSDQGGGWEAVFEITAALAEIIDPDLKWVISMPLMDGNRKPIGVMSVDGLVEEFTFDALNRCTVPLTNCSLAIAGIIMGN